jgi:histone-lysine N-methyltransferase SETMAR
MTMPAHTHCRHNTRSLHDIWLGTIQHPPYSPDLAPSDFHVFLHLKTFLGGWQFHDDKVKEAVNMWFASQVASFYNAGIQKQVPHCDKCFNNGGNSVEK